MNNIEKYLLELERELYFFDQEEISQILDEYHELYTAKLESGSSEQEAIKSFDQPKVVAQNYALELGYTTNKLSKHIVNINKKIKNFIANTNEKAANTFNSVKRTPKEETGEIEINTVDKTNSKSRFSTFITSFIIYPLFYIYYLIIFLLNFMIKLFAISTWLCTIIIFILSFIFVDLEVYTKILRSLEIILFFCISICCFILMSIKVGKHE